ncbi:MAG: hypothetical protein O3C29_13040 [Proteobacteria bacterium]|nr:hypothetical protein [Pseudomonadota bacterium]MDA1292035.1 hypothetical protein [Pseudomonadota bacterium]
MKKYFLSYKTLHYANALVVAALVFFPALVAAESLDEGVLEDAFLLTLSDALGAYDIDVTSNLNSREVMRQRIQRPRLGRFPDLPTDSLASSEEIANWETAYLESEIGGVAILLDEIPAITTEVFTGRWLDSDGEKRLFITFFQDDLAAAEKLADVVSAYGHVSDLYFGAEHVAAAGQLYATAAQRLAIDSRSARRYRSEVTELDFLGERVRRKSTSLFVDDGNRGDDSQARREPSVFLKETLGDEFNQSTIEAIIVPGGVALGEIASLNFVPSDLIFDGKELMLVGEDGENWRLPEIDLADAKALFDYVTRSEAINSDAIVDIDGEGRVRISSALRDTDVGFAIMHADTQPFEFVSNLPVTKSVIIDSGVDWQQVEKGEPLQFEVDYEVRFLSADNMRIAQTRAALKYEYASERESSEYSDSWGRYVGRLDDNLDYSGLGQSMAGVATYAGWLGLFRRLHEDQVSFLRGRYQFMKIDKSGKRTPSRY